MRTPQPNNFGMTSNDQDIFDYPVRDELGLNLKSTNIPIPGMVSFYEENTVRTKRGYTIQSWRDLQPIERATEVALYRIENLIEYIRADKERQKIEHESKRKGR